MKRRKGLKLTFRLYPGQDDDLIRWLSGLDGQPYGVKSQAVKDALRRGIGMAGGSPPAVSAVDLGELRAVVEAAVENTLTRLGGLALARHGLEADPEDETERLLNGLGEALVL